MWAVGVVRSVTGTVTLITPYLAKFWEKIYPPHGKCCNGIRNVARGRPATTAISAVPGGRRGEWGTVPRLEE